jgi:CBS domain-containing protein
MTLVRDRMTTPAVTVHANTFLPDVVKLFDSKSISALPVVDDDRLVGVVSTTDVVRSLSGAQTRPLTASSLMSSPPLIARADEGLDEAAWRLVAGRVHRLVVTDGDRPIGILAARDCLEELLTRRVKDPVRAIMTTPAHGIDIRDSIDEATSRLASANVHGLVVVDGMEPVGVYTHKEAIAARALPPELRRRPVESVMSYETICLDVATPIHRAAAYAMVMNVRRFLVVEHRRLAGIVSCIDLVAALSRVPELSAIGTA